MRLLLLLIISVTLGFAGNLKNENILLGLPFGFKLGNKAYDPKTHYSLFEYVPNTETVYNWSEMLTVNIYHSNVPMSAEKYTDYIKSLWMQSCKNGDTKDLLKGIENGYRYSLIMLSCPKSITSNKDEFTWMKAVQGHDGFYVVQRAVSKAPDKKKIIQIIQYLKTVQICDTRLNNCPQLKKLDMKH